MPVIIPTTDELARMSAYQRARTARRLARTGARQHADAMATPHGWDATTGAHAAWGALVRDTARDMLAALPADPNAAAHRAELVTLWA